MLNRTVFAPVKLQVENEIQLDAPGASERFSDMENHHDISSFKRFLHLGIEKGVYKSAMSHTYPTTLEQSFTTKLTRNGNGAELINIIKSTCKDPSFCQSAGVYALAVCDTSSNALVVNKAHKLLNVVCTTPHAILQFVAACERLTKKPFNTTGWGRSRRSAIQQWYSNKPSSEIAYAVTSCKTYQHWSHKDLLKLCHINPSNDLCCDILCSYIMKGFSKTKDRFSKEVCDTPDAQELFDLLEAVRRVKLSKPEEVVATASLISKYKMAWGHVPCHLQNDQMLWRKLLSEISLPVLLQNLPRIHAKKMVEKEDLWSKVLLQRLLNVNDIQQSGIHPCCWLYHHHEYKLGKKIKKKYRWEPDAEVLSALEVAFYISLKGVRPTQKRIFVTVSTSMKGKVLHWNQVPCQTFAVAFCLAMAQTEPHAQIYPFAKKWSEIEIKEDMLSVAQSKFEKIPVQYGSPDLARPLIRAKKDKKEIDTFIVITDDKVAKPTGNKTTTLDALAQYREVMKIPARLIVLALSSEKDLIPLELRQDNGVLSISGFNERVPNIIHDFILEKF
ncbi:unnamed protein product [Clavelina lepadiformis]|uniref:TROVE domain-containing protein n=1 Tax=Clavelina lepadiformis TaxID=159417 RepID=A0ABP0GGH1_CLALP